MRETKSNDVKATYDVKFLSERYLPQILRLQDIIVKNLADRAVYHAATPEMVRSQLAIDKSVIGLFKNEQLLGFNIFELPGLNTENFGEDIGLNQEELVKVVEFGPVGVHPKYRNKGLLGMIIEKHLEVVKEKGYEHVCLSIAPTNFPSLKRTLSYGFVIKQVKQKFGNLLRYILHLNIKKPYTKPRYSIKIPSADIETQRYMIKLGYCGYGISINDDGVDIIFGLQ